MEVIERGTRDNYDECVVYSHVFERNGEYQSEPRFIRAMRYSNQFSYDDLLVSSAIDATTEYYELGFRNKPDIRKVVIEYITY